MASDSQKRPATDAQGRPVAGNQSFTVHRTLDGQLGPRRPGQRLPGEGDSDFIG